MKTICPRGVEAAIFRMRITDNEIVSRSHKRLLRFITTTNTRSDVSFSAILNKLGIDVPRASAYVPCLLAEPFGITDQFLIEEITYASMCLDTFSRAVDAVTDKPEKGDSLIIHLGSLCLGKAAQIYGGLLPRGDGFWKYWEHYLKEASESEQFLWRHQDAIVAFGNDDFIKLGNKSALIKMSAAFYASFANRWEILDDIERGLVATATGVQLMDDLLDWEDDLSGGTYTYPLVLAEQKRLPDQSLAQSLNSNDIVTLVLRSATEYLECGKKHFGEVQASSMLIFINDLLHNIDVAKKYIQHFHNPNLKYSEIPITKHLRRMITPKMAH